jgi:succinoglycan biosynthesis protein ExoA
MNLVLDNMSSEYPIVSIIMPLLNEEVYIQRCLDSLLAQDYPREKMEIIVVDGMSDDGTRKIIRSAQQNNTHIFLIDNPSKIVPVGLNLAIRRARGEFIIRIDGHTFIAPDYVRNCVNELQRSGADNVGGKMSAEGETFFGEVVAIATSSPFGVGGARFHYSNQEEWVDTVYLGAWRKKVFLLAGLFDEELVRNQDDEFNYRLRALGGKILLSPRIKSTYIVRGSPKKLCHQYFQYGLWKVRVMQKHIWQMRIGHFVPLGFVVGGIGLLLVSLVYSPARIIFGIYTGLYLIANLCATVWLTTRYGWKYIFVLPFVFAILHLAYGLGFLTGLFRFARRWQDNVVHTPNYTIE